ncbi:MAG: hypothetical protein AAFU54_24510 [Chloroflexota bacterium]
MIPAVMIRAIELNLRTPAQVLQAAKDEENPITSSMTLVMLLEAGVLDAEQSAEARTLAIQRIEPQLANNRHGHQYDAKRLLPRLFPLVDGTQLNAVFDLMLEHGLDFGAPVDLIAETLQVKHWERLVAYAQERPTGPGAWRKPTGLVYRMMSHVPQEHIPALVDDALSRDGLAHQVAGYIKNLAPWVNPAQALRLLEKTQAMEPDAYYTSHRGECMAALAVSLPREGMEVILAHARNYDGGQPYVPPLIVSAAVSRGRSLLHEAVTLICQLEGYWQVNEMLANLVPYLPHTDYVSKLVAFVEMAPAQDYHHTVYPLLPLVDDIERDRLVQTGIDNLMDVLAADPDSISDEYRVGSFRRIAPHITANTLDAALNKLVQIKSHRERCYMYIDLLPVVPAERRHEVMRLALDVADGSTLAPNIVGSNGALQRLAPHLESDLLEEAFAGAVFPRMPDYIQQMEDTMGRSFKNDYIRGGNGVLAALAPKMTTDMVQALLERDGV